MASTDEKFRPRGATVVGVHTPEFEPERDPANVRREVRRLGITYPVVLDNDNRMWDALDNHSWPSLYLIDRKGRIRATHAGEIHAGTGDARGLEELIETLLREPADTPPGSAAAGR